MTHQGIAPAADAASKHATLQGQARRRAMKKRRKATRAARRANR